MMHLSPKFNRTRPENTFYFDLTLFDLQLQQEDVQLQLALQMYDDSIVLSIIHLRLR